MVFPSHHSDLLPSHVLCLAWYYFISIHPTRFPSSPFPVYSPKCFAIRSSAVLTTCPFHHKHLSSIVFIKFVPIIMTTTMMMMMIIIIIIMYASVSQYFSIHFPVPNHQAFRSKHWSSWRPRSFVTSLKPAVQDIFGLPAFCFLFINWFHFSIFFENLSTFSTCQNNANVLFKYFLHGITTLKDL